MTDKTKERTISLDELAKLANAATAGPWRAEKIEDAPEVFWRINGLHENKSLLRDEADMKYVAAVNPDTILKLIASLKEAMTVLQFYAKVDLYHTNALADEAREALASIKKRLGDE